MSQKKLDNLGQTQHSNEESTSNYIKGSIVEYLRSHGIPSENTTHEKIGQTSLMFTNRSKQPLEDDSTGASIRFLKFKRFNP